nr:circovirus capsid protein [Cressdnaviricota sp.]
MPIRRRFRIRPKAKKQAMARRRRMIYSNSRTFTETVGTDLSGNRLSVLPGGVKFGITAQQIPQMADLYAKLYRQFKITRVVAHLVPQFLAQDQNQAYANAFAVSLAPGVTAPSITWAVNDSADDITTPTTELQVLECNGSKVALLNKIWKQAFRPVPYLTSGTPLVPVAVTKRNQWLSMDSALNVEHVGIDAWINQNAVGGGTPTFTNFFVYYKVTFQVRDPR